MGNITKVAYNGKIFNINDSETSNIVDGLKTSMEILQGTGDGSINSKIINKIAEVVANAPEKFDTLKEVADWIESDTTGAAKMQSDISTLKTDINNIDSTISTMKSNFQAGVDSIYNAVVSAGTTPNSNSLNDIVQSIGTLNSSIYENIILNSDLGNCNFGNESIELSIKNNYVTLIGRNVTNMSNMFKNNTSNIIPTCGINVTNMVSTYENCTNLTGSPVCGNNVTSMYYTYYNCTNLDGSPVCGPNVIDMSSTYSNCTNLTGNPVCGNNVIYMHGTYINCYNLTGSPVCGSNVTTMYNTYYNCINLTGSPVCGDNVIYMSSTYYNCINLTGSPVCGDNVIYMSSTYSNCYNLTSNPVCGNNVSSMFYTYFNCYNLTGSPVCGNNVSSMYDTYFNCTNLTGSPVCGDNVINMYQTYYNCPNLYGNMYMNYTGNTMSSNVNAENCFRGRNNLNRLNIFVKNGYAWNNWLYNVGKLCNNTKLTWTTMTNGYYNIDANIYVYYN